MRPARTATGWPSGWSAPRRCCASSPSRRANERAFTALTRFLDLLDDTPPGGRRPALDPLGLSFQLKLLWLSGYLPHVRQLRGVRGRTARSPATRPARGGRSARRAARGALALSPDGLGGMDALLRSPLADARAAGLTERGARDVLAVITSSYEEHGGFRLRTLRGVMSAELGDGYELDDDPARIDVDAVHDYLANESYWAEGRPRETRRAARPRGARASSASTTTAARSGSRGRSRDGVALAYLADVYVLPEYRGRGLGVELVREMVENGPLADVKWILHTRDAHDLYRRFGFCEPSERVLERRPG